MKAIECRLYSPDPLAIQSALAPLFAVALRLGFLQNAIRSERGALRHLRGALRHLRGALPQLLLATQLWHLRGALRHLPARCSACAVLSGTCAVLSGTHLRGALRHLRGALKQLLLAAQLFINYIWCTYETTLKRKES
jgi:hypothetical protein